jgi:hypothetical protein
MTDNKPTDTSTDDVLHSEVGRGRMTLLLIAGIPVIVILASTWMWFYVSSGKLDVVGALGTANRGVLVQPPRQVLDEGWNGVEGQPFALATSPRWSMVVPHHGARCDAACEQVLYTTRQIHMALGKELGRVQRLMVADEDLAELTLDVARLSDERPLPASFSDYLATEQRGLTLWQATPGSFGTLFREYLAQPDTWYLMDPSGWVMMRYDSSVSYKDVISDMKFLIRNSNG